MRLPQVLSEHAAVTVNSEHWDAVVEPSDPAARLVLVWWRDGVRGELPLGGCACHKSMRCPAKAQLYGAARHLRDVVDHD